jgi:hypothetical protein
MDRTGRKPWAKIRRFTPGNKEQTLGKNKKSPQDERGTKVSLLKGKPGQGENLGQKQEITPRRTGNKG